MHVCPLCAGVDGGGPHGKKGDADARLVKAASAAKDSIDRISAGNVCWQQLKATTAIKVDLLELSRLRLIAEAQVDKTGTEEEGTNCNEAFN